MAFFIRKYLKQIDWKVAIIGLNSFAITKSNKFNILIENAI